LGENWTCLTTFGGSLPYQISGQSVRLSLGWTNCLR